MARHGKNRTTRMYAVSSATLIMIAVLIGYEVSPWPFESNAHVQNSMSVPVKNAEPADGLFVITPVPEAPIVPASAPSGDAIATPQQAAPMDIVTPVPIPAVVSASTAVKGNSSGSKKIALQFDREAWVEIRQANGKTLLSQLNPGGSRQVIEGIPPFILIIGNAPNVHLSYNNQAVDLRPHFKVDVARLTLE